MKRMVSLLMHFRLTVGTRNDRFCCVAFVQRRKRGWLRISDGDLTRNLSQICGQCRVHERAHPIRIDTHNKSTELMRLTLFRNKSCSYCMDFSGRSVCVHSFSTSILFSYSDIQFKLSFNCHILHASFIENQFDLQCSFFRIKIMDNLFICNIWSARSFPFNNSK